METQIPKNKFTVIFFGTTTIFLFSAVQLIESASVFPRFDVSISKSIFEPLCSNQSERIVESNGRDSSLFLEFRSNVVKKKICEKNLTAPESHVFSLRLVMPKKTKTNKNIKKNPNMIGHHDNVGNFSKSCPLSIFSSLGLNHTNQTQPLWRLDPCQLEISPEKEDPIKFFPAQIKIVWEHHQNTLDSKLMITAMGKGYKCEGVNKFPCLKVGDESILCISKDLICDNIRHCPKGDEYENDEDVEMCSKRKRPSHPGFNDLFEHFTMEILQNLYASEISPSDLDPNSAGNSNIDSDESNDIEDFNKFKNFIDISGDPLNENGQLPNGYDSINNNKTKTGGKRKIHKNNLSNDLSKYGPWGYLMLGMLLCGGALLVCGLWECCCRQNKTDPNATGVSSINDSMESPSRTQDSTPPNYDEIDPPPAYSVLFPNQKDLSSQLNFTTSTGASQSSNTSTVAGSTVTQNSDVSLLTTSTTSSS